MKLRFLFIPLFFICCCFVNQISAYTYDLAACMIFKNEAQYLKEWIEFHKLQGVQHFYLYNNNSTDNYMEVLAPYIASNEIELFDWSYPNQQFCLTQVAAYNDVLKKATGQVKWLIVIDSDEFLFVVKEDSNLVTFLEKFETDKKIGGIIVNWQTFGTSHVEQIPPDKLLIETLVLKAKKNWEENTFVKSIVRPECVNVFLNPHNCIFRRGFYQVNPKFGISFGGNRKKFAIEIDDIRINHYWTRDEKFLDIKLNRGIEVRGESSTTGLKRASKLNQEEDLVIQHFVPELRRRCGFSELSEGI